MSEYPSQRKIALGVVGWTILVVLLVAGISVAVWFFKVATADIKGRGDVRRTVKSAPYRIAAYEHFYNLCAAVQGHEAALDAQYAQLDETTDPPEQDRIRANIAGLQSIRGQAIAQYNADARKSYTQGQFRASELPYQLPTGLYDHTKGVHTSCTV